MQQPQVAKMAKSPAEPERKKKTQVIIDPVIAQKIGIIVSVFGDTIQDWVNNRLAEVVDVHLGLAMDKMGLEVKPKK